MTGKEEAVDITMVITLSDHGPALLPCRFASDHVSWRPHEMRWSRAVAPVTWWSRRDAPPPKWFIQRRVALKHQTFVILKDQENIEWMRGWITEESDEGKALIAAFALVSEGR